MVMTAIITIIMGDVLDLYMSITFRLLESRFRLP